MLLYRRYIRYVILALLMCVGCRNIPYSATCETTEIDKKLLQYSHAISDIGKEIQEIEKLVKTYETKDKQDNIYEVIKSASMPLNEKEVLLNKMIAYAHHLNQIREIYRKATMAHDY